MRITGRSLLAMPLLLALAACGSDQQSGQSGAQSYKDTKTIVLDVLKTEDGQKAILESQAKSQDKTAQLLATGQGQQIQLAVKDILTGPESNKLLQQTMTDPRFAADFAKAVQSNMKQLHKDLMKDPDYQQQLLQVMNNPEYEKMVLQTMKGAAYRQQIMNVMQEALQSPLYRVQLIDMLKKVVEEETKPGGQAGQQGGGQQAGGQKGGGGKSSAASSDSGDSGGGSEKKKSSGGSGDSGSSDQEDDSQKKKDKTKQE